MARIRKEDHARILHLVDVERRPVREIAADFGCTSANIYSLLARLRRDGDKAAAVADEADAMSGTEILLPPEQPGLSLEAGSLMPQPEIAAPAERGPPVARPDAAWDDAARGDAVRDGASLRGAPQIVAFEPLPAKAVARDRPGGGETEMRTPGSRGAVGARLAKPGMGLVMRAEDGEETMTPFGSIDDLLSAIKPILRATARSAEPLWFSIQPVDLSAIEVDAA